MRNLISALAALVLFLVAGCAGESWMTKNGSSEASADAGHTHSDVGGQPKQDVAVCTPKCNGKNCGDNGCGGTCGACDSDETCNGASLCTPKSAAHACVAGATCDVGERCWCDASGAFTCYALTGMCVTTNGKETCESTSSYTSTCVGGSTCVGADMGLKVSMCSGDLYNCKKTGCATGLFCNSATGKCESDSSPGSAFVGYDHVFCAWASVKLTGVYGGQTNSVDSGALANMVDWTYVGDDPKAGGWVQVGDKFCRGVTGIGRAVRILAQTKDGDFPGWVASSGGKYYSLPFTIYGSWDNGVQGAATEASQNCENGAPNKAICQYNKGSLNGNYGVVFPAPQ
jgi:hypothetical protein